MTSTQPWYQWDGEDLLLSVHIQPRARHNEISGPYGDRLKIRITAPPVDNKANDNLIEFLADLFGVNSTDVRLVGGSKGRDKRLRIHRPRLLPATIPSRDTL